MDRDDEDQEVQDPTPELDQEDMVESDSELYDAQGWSDQDLVKGTKKKLLQVQGPREDAHPGHQVSKLQDRPKMTHAQRGQVRAVFGMHERKTILSVGGILAHIGDHCHGVVGQLTEDWGEALISVLKRAGRSTFTKIVVSEVVIR